MAYCELNGEPVLSWRLAMPRVGVWIADLAVGSQTTFAGAVTLTMPGIVARGTVLRAGVTRDTATVRVVGGAGRMGRELPPKFYRHVTAKIPLADLLTEAGERLAARSDPAVLGTFFGAWARQRAPAADAMRTLADELGAAWRVLDSGEVWVGQEMWTSADVDHVLVLEEPDAGRMVIATDDHRLRPGMTFRGRRIARVEISGNAETVRTELGYETEAGDGDRMRASIAALVRQETAGIDYLAQYVAKVVAQNADGTLEVKPDDDRLPGMTRVPIRYGIPGVTATVAPGARVLVGFEAGHPARPFATVWESASLLEIKIGGTAATAAAVASLVEAQLAALKSAIQAAPVVAGDGGASFKTALVLALAAWPGSTGAAKVKVV